MSKIIETGSDSRVKLLSGVEQLAGAVVATLGPNGRNVVIAQQGGNLPQSTKDGVTVAKTVTLKDPVENLGAQMVKQAAVQTGDLAGDGTTTSKLLAKELITEGMNHLSQKHNAVAIKRGMDKTTKEITQNRSNIFDNKVTGKGGGETSVQEEIAGISREMAQKYPNDTPEQHKERVRKYIEENAIAYSQAEICNKIGDYLTEILQMDEKQLRDNLEEQ